jgi:hypothetical protein
LGKNQLPALNAQPSWVIDLLKPSLLQGVEDRDSSLTVPTPSQRRLGRDQPMLSPRDQARHSVRYDVRDGLSIHQSSDQDTPLMDVLVHEFTAFRADRTRTPIAQPVFPVRLRNLPDADAEKLALVSWVKVKRQ